MLLFPFSFTQECTWMSHSLWFEDDYIVNIVPCLGAVHYRCSSLNTWLQLACFNTHSSSGLLILVLSQPRSLEWGEKVLINSKQASNQPETSFKFASCFYLSSLNDPRPNNVHWTTSGAHFVFLKAQICVSPIWNKCTAHGFLSLLYSPSLSLPSLAPSISTQGPWEELTLGADSLQPWINV